jgi:hypothetical protein
MNYLFRLSLCLCPNGAFKCTVSRDSGLRDSWRRFRSVELLRSYPDKAALLIRTEIIETQGTHRQVKSSQLISNVITPYQKVESSRRVAAARIGR